MKRALWLAIFFLTTSLYAENVAERYALFGQLIFTNLDTAPFPHPDRKAGHRYKDEVFTLEKNYSDNAVAIFVPKEILASSKVDFVIHFHGWRNSVTNVLRQYELIEQLMASGKNAVLVVPQGPLNAADSFGGKLEDAGGFDRFIIELLKVLKTTTSLTNATAGQIVLSGHSGGYRVMSAIAAQTNQFPVSEIWLFDALYGQTEKFVGWFERNPKARLLNIYTENGGTKKETEILMANLREKHTPFISGTDTTIPVEALRTNRLCFLFTDLAHDEVLQKRKTFQTFLSASKLPKR